MTNILIMSVIANKLKNLKKLSRNERSDTPESYHTSLDLE